MRRNQQWVMVGIAVLVIILAIGGGAALHSDIGLVGPGRPAPSFDAVRVATGDSVTLADYSGEVVLLNIWATWCKPCEEEMPSLQRLHEQLGAEGLHIVAVSIDRSSQQDVLAWVQARGLTFDILQDRSRRIERLYQTTGVPETFIIDRYGAIAKRQIGAYEWDDPPTKAFLRRLLQSRPDTARAAGQS